MADPQDVQESLKSLRRRLDELESRRRRAMGDLRSAILGTALAASMVVLTATTWAVDGEDPYTLWGLVPEGWPAFAMLALVVGTALTTTLLFLSDPPSRTGHLAMVWISLLTAAWVIAVNTTVPEDSHTAPGRWLTLLAALATATAHGTRAEDLRGTKRP
jgi:hypothetical protein